MKIVTIVGARPQFIKGAVVSRAIADHNKSGSGPKITEIIIHTGQHYDHSMSGIFFDEMEIPIPDINLDVRSGRHGEMTGAMMVGIERKMLEIKPDIALVYGDTNSTMAGAVAAAKLNVPVAHVEAGLRSFNRKMPEEVNRVVTDHLSSILFCPSAASAAHLAREGITEGVHVVGDVMCDAALHYKKRAKPVTAGEPFALCTIHRAENTDNIANLKAIIDALSECPVKVVLALHPRTREAMQRHGLVWPSKVSVHEPFSYLAMLGYLEACSFVITDSGGLQKEAYFMGRKCVTVRGETEWTELVDAGANIVAGIETGAVISAMRWAMQSGIPAREGIYGDGRAGSKIVELLANARRTAPRLALL